MADKNPKDGKEKDDEKKVPRLELPTKESRSSFRLKSSSSLRSITSTKIAKSGELIRSASMVSLPHETIILDFTKKHHHLMGQKEYDESKTKGKSTPTAVEPPPPLITPIPIEKFFGAPGQPQEGAGGIKKPESVRGVPGPRKEKDPAQTQGQPQPQIPKTPIEKFFGAPGQPQEGAAGGIKKPESVRGVPSPPKEKDPAQTQGQPQAQTPQTPTPSIRRVGDPEASNDAADDKSGVYVFDFRRRREAEEKKLEDEKKAAEALEKAKKADLALAKAKDKKKADKLKQEKIAAAKSVANAKAKEKEAKKILSKVQFQGKPSEPPKQIQARKLSKAPISPVKPDPSAKLQSPSPIRRGSGNTRTPSLGPTNPAEHDITDKLAKVGLPISGQANFDRLRTNLNKGNEFRTFGFGDQLRYYWSPVLRTHCLLNANETYKTVDRFNKSFTAINCRTLKSKVDEAPSKHVEQDVFGEGLYDDLRKAALDDVHYEYLKSVAESQTVTTPFTIMRDILDELVPATERTYQYYSSAAGRKNTAIVDRVGASYDKMKSKFELYDSIILKVDPKPVEEDPEKKPFSFMDTIQSNLAALQNLIASVIPVAVEKKSTVEKKVSVPVPVPLPKPNDTDVPENIPGPVSVPAAATAAQLPPPTKKPK